SNGMVKNIDLSGIRQILLYSRGQGGIEVHIDAADGPLAGEAPFGTKDGWQVLTVNLLPVNGRHDVYFVFVNKKQRFSGISLQWVRFIN
ncbi:MAG TPA: carbohydrate-binding protein, partial [Chitinophagaceae bacterium]